MQLETRVLQRLLVTNPKHCQWPQAAGAEAQAVFHILCKKLLLRSNVSSPGLIAAAKRVREKREDRHQHCIVLTRSLYISLAICTHTKH